MTDNPTIQIEINGQSVQCQPGESVIAAADRHGISIPRFCYHPKLSVVASCRMCLVDVEQSNKPLPACKTIVSDGMVVRTKSELAIEAQRAIMEFLLINHPLDCPICDQGGECELQDVSMGYGFGETDYQQAKRTVADENLGPLIATDMTRCIHCSRCVRFGDEVAGMPELGMTGRGENTRISTYLKHSMESELSGNVIDLCPVGALTSKPHRYHGRSWEYTQHHSISPHDCVGSHLYYHIVDKKSSEKNRVTRVVPRANETINQNWISNRDRFSYQGLEHHQRLKQPMMKKSGKWEEVTWQNALYAVQAKLEHVSPDNLYGIINPTATLEEMYLFRQWLDHYQCVNFDHRLKECDFSDQAEMPLYPGSLDLSLEAVETMESILMIGGNTRAEAPLFNHRIRQATQQHQSRVHELNMLDFESNYPQGHRCIVSPQQFAHTLSGWLMLASDEVAPNLPDSSSKSGQAIIDDLTASNQSLIVLGLSAQSHPQSSQIRRIAKRLAKKTGSKLILITDGPNTAGAWITGMLPHRKPFGQTPETVGQHITHAWQQRSANYILYQVEPDLDCFDGHLARSALEHANCVIAFHSYRSPSLEQHADIILPLSSHVENAGTFINICGQWQSFSQAMPHRYNSRPGWVVLQKLCHLLSNNHPIVSDITTLSQTINNQFNTMSPSFTRIPTKEPESVKPLNHKLMNHNYWSPFKSDALVRRASALQQTLNQSKLLIHPDTAKQYAIRNKQVVTIKSQYKTIQLPCEFNLSIPIGCSAIHQGCDSVLPLPAIGHITLSSVEGDQT